MPFALLRLAEAQNIAIEYWDFPPPLEAVYLSEAGLPPVIGLAWGLLKNRTHFRCVLAEELGHHFTTAGDAIPKTYFHYRNRLLATRAEYRALKWAALYLIPTNKLQYAFQCGVHTHWDLAEHFDVTFEMMSFRLQLPDISRYKAS